MALKVGEKAADFELYGKEAGADAPTYRLSDALAGSGVVLQILPTPLHPDLPRADVRRSGRR